ncbi:MAG TPA: UbiD family decarboxylase [Thermoplasmata archaeon]|nr:UbiD family decarboxylase [Thermoplasmata archaeon]
MRDFVNLLDKKGSLIKIKKAVDIKYEVSTLMKLMDGKPLLFENVKGFSMPVVANLCSARELVALGLGIQQKEIMKSIAHAIENPKQPRIVEAKDYREVEPDLSQFPILTYYPSDGGPYIASAIVVAEDREYGINASYHRMMQLGKNKLVLRILPRNFNEFIKRGLREFAICIGNPVSVLVASSISVEIGKSELAIANSLNPIEMIEVDGHKVPHSDIVIIAELTGEHHEEGPFLDLTETPDIVRKQRVARVKKVFVRENPMFQAVLPGGLEHKTLMGMPREPTIYGEVNKVCECKEVLITPGGCSWLHGAVSIKKKHPDDGKKAIEAAFKGHKSMKHVFVVDEDIDISDPNEIEWAMATRFQGREDVLIKQEKGSSLDPSSNLETRETTKIGFDLTVPWGRDPKAFKKLKLPLKLNIEDYTE